jgi:long-chain fatty acid transport protein
MRKLRNGLVLCVLGLCLAASGLRAQTNDDINSGLQFNFSTPGARSLGMGGAFLALADDATAAYTNPAGLTNLTVGGSESSLELRQWRYSNVFTERGHVLGPPSGIGIDTVSGLKEGQTDSEVNGLSFLSLGYVLPKGFTLALYRHELANFKAGILSEEAFVGSGERRRDGERDLIRILPARSTLDLQIVNYGLSSAYELAHKISIGVGVSFYQLDLASLTERFDLSEQDADRDGDVDTEDDRLNRQPGGFFGPADLLGDNQYNIQTQRGDGTAWGVNFGVLWKINPLWSVGAAYRHGPDFDIQARYVNGPKRTAAGQSDSFTPCTPSQTRDCLGGQGILHVPDVYGVGVAWATAEGKTKLTLDYDRVQYSQLVKDLINILVRERSDFKSSNYQVSDGNEIHVGFENILGIGSQLVATLRLGGWYDPAHKVEYVGTDPTLRTRFRPGDDQIHGAAGVGIVIRENLQVDAAIDIASRSRTASLSFVKFF